MSTDIKNVITLKDQGVDGPDERVSDGPDERVSNNRLKLKNNMMSFLSLKKVP